MSSQGLYLQTRASEKQPKKLLDPNSDLGFEGREEETWLKNSCSRQSSQGSATAMGLTSLEMSLTFTMIFISWGGGGEQRPLNEGVRRRAPGGGDYAHHFLVVFVGEVENGLDAFELVENFVVPRHVRRQDAPEERPRVRWEGAESLAAVLLDHRSSDLLVLLAGQVFKDVALWLKRKKQFLLMSFEQVRPEDRLWRPPGTASRPPFVL